MEPGAPCLPIRSVAVIGAGVAGRSFALACAVAGFDVVLEDVMPANLRKAEADFSAMAPPARTGTLRLAVTVEDAVRDADIAIDFVPDELESKLEIFSMMDRMAPPKTILCTPSYALSITDLASCVYRPERCVAFRGSLLQPPEPAILGLLYPESITQNVLTAVLTFFDALGLAPRPEPDPDVPMLMKNAARAAV